MLSLFSAPSLRSLLALSTSALLFAGCAAEEAPSDDDSEEVDTDEAELGGCRQFCWGNSRYQRCGRRVRLLEVCGGTCWSAGGQAYCQGDDGPEADCEPGQCRGYQTCSGGTWVNVSCAQRAGSSKVHCRGNGYCG